MNLEFLTAKPAARRAKICLPKQIFRPPAPLNHQIGRQMWPVPCVRPVLPLEILRGWTAFKQTIQPPTGTSLTTFCRRPLPLQIIHQRAAFRVGGASCLEEVCFDHICI